MRVSVAQASRPKPGERECGDRVVVVEGDTHVLVAVVDGLGHGPEAALAAMAAETFLVANASLPLADMFRSCDRALIGTRGAAMAVIRVDRAHGLVAHAAVGNVELRAISRERVRPVPEPGFLGGRFRRVRETSYPLSPGDLVVLFSDGVSSRLELEPYRNLKTTDRAAGAAMQAFSGYQRVLSVGDIARAVIRDHGKAHDDASCAVVAC